MLVWKSLTSVFQNFSLSINKTFFYKGDWALDYYVWRVSLYFLVSEDPQSEVVRQLLRQPVYTLFLSNNRRSFHLWREDNLVKHQNVSEY